MIFPSISCSLRIHQRLGHLVCSTHSIVHVVFVVVERSASGASMPRSSSIYGFGGPEKLKDTRPLHDKAFVQQCIRQLHEVGLAVAMLYALHTHFVVVLFLLFFKLFRAKNGEPVRER